MCGSELSIGSVQAEAGVTWSDSWLEELGTLVWDQNRGPLKQTLEQ